MRTVVGKLVNVSNRFWFFTTQEGEELRIHFDGEDRPPVEQKIALAISDEPEFDDGGFLCTAEGRYWTRIANSAAAAPNPTKKHIAVYWQHWPGKDKDKEMRKALEWSAELQRFYKIYSRKKWDVVVKPFLWEGNIKATPPSYGLMEIRRLVDLGDFDPNYHHVISIYPESSYCGLGNVSGDKSATYLYGNNCAEHTVIHELGHNFGLNHANDHTDGEYRDKSCVMGMGPSIPGLNAPHMLELGIETDRERIDINKSTQLLMCPVELPEHAMHEEEWQHVVLEKDGHDRLYLSLRKDKGWPWLPGRQDENDLFVHYRKDGKTWLHSVLSPSETVKTLPNRVRLTYHEFANETARITLDYNDDVIITPVAMPTGFPEIFTGAELGEQHSGLWYDRDLDGQGFQFLIKNGFVIVHWFTYNVEEGSRRYYYGKAQLAEGSEEFDLYTTSNGDFLSNDNAVVEKVGQGQLYFTSKESGVFNYRTTEHGRGSVEIKPVALSNSLYDGEWTGGITSSVFPHLNKAIFFWSTYGKKLTAYQRNGYETQRWFYCDTDKVEDNKYSGTIYETRNGKFMTPIKPDLVSVGTITVTFTSENTAQIEYDINADTSTIGSDIMEVVRK